MNLDISVASHHEGQLLADAKSVEHWATPQGSFLPWDDSEIQAAFTASTISTWGPPKGKRDRGARQLCMILAGKWHVTSAHSAWARTSGVVTT